jgi:hypothetical protein
MTSEGCPPEHPKTVSFDADSRSTDRSIWCGSQSLNACMKCKTNTCRDFFFSAYEIIDMRNEHDQIIWNEKSSCYNKNLELNSCHSS